MDYGGNAGGLLQCEGLELVEPENVVRSKTFHGSSDGAAIDLPFSACVCERER